MHASPSTATHATWTSKPGHVPVRIDEKGKVHHAERDSPADRVGKYHGSYLHIPVGDFASWKGAGKRTPSNKFSDPETGSNYERVAGRYHPYAGKSFSPTPVPDSDAPPGGQSSHDKLHARLIDRSRPDRTAASSPLERYDVGPYHQAVTLPGSGKTYPALPTAHGAWSANNDHVPSGQSLKLRNKASGQTAADAAYEQGITIAIPSDEHRIHSPTYGGRQTSKDTTTTGKRKRVEHDEESPASAAVRDIAMMVDSTAATRSQQERATQLGAYRTLWRMNTRLHDQIGSGRGVDSQEPAEEAVHTAKKVKTGPKLGTFDYSGLAGQTQGEVMAGRFGDWLVGANLATR